MTLYATGRTEKGEILIGGIWTLWHQDGFPLEMSHLMCRDRGWLVDWMEALCDSCQSNNLHALMKHIEAFLPKETVFEITKRFDCLMSVGKTCEEIVANKKAHGKPLSEL